MRIRFNFGTKNRRQLTQRAEEIAERSQIEVSRRLAGLSPNMSVAEARGYIRTRAAVVVHRQANLLLKREPGLRPSDRSELIDLATDRLVESFLKASPELRRQRFAA